MYDNPSTHLQLGRRAVQILSIPNRKSLGAEILRECSFHTMRHMSCDMCHVSHVMWNVSNVTCHWSPVTGQNNFCHLFFGWKKNILVLFFSLKKTWQSGLTSWWTASYKRGVPRLVSFFNNISSDRIWSWKIMFCDIIETAFIFSEAFEICQQVFAFHRTNKTDSSLKAYDWRHKHRNWLY